jgi:hypothetical protein
MKNIIEREIKLSETFPPPLLSDEEALKLITAASLEREQTKEDCCKLLFFANSAIMKYNIIQEALSGLISIHITERGDYAIKPIQKVGKESKK